MSEPTPTIVLVHGAWADASGWSAVILRLQQDGLADSRLTAQDQHPAVTRAHLVQQSVQYRPLAIATTQCLGQ